MDHDRFGTEDGRRARLAALPRRMLEGPAGDRLMRAAIGMLYSKRLRPAALGVARALLPFIVAPGAGGRRDSERLAFARAILETCGRRVPQGTVPRGLLELASQMITHPGHVRGDRPWLLALAPTRDCNLSCGHCYASSAGAPGSSLPFNALDRIVTDARRQWGVRAIVLTGGEPFIYRSGGTGAIDLIERHRDLMFLVFTNGTLIDAPLAQRLARAGNAAVAVSIEGMEGATDGRRGPGAFEGAVSALTLLREAGALAGISMTATRRNCEEIFSDELLDFFFDRRGVSFGFVFQYMPEGRDADPSLMPTPEQRLWLWDRSWQVVRERGILLFDFWNHGSLLGGCIAAGRERGYLYVDWDGNVLPCVFAPFTDRNIHDIFASGGGLEEAWDSPLLSSVRGWQREHATRSGIVASPGAGGGLMCSCPVRDHYADFAEMVLANGAEPVDALTGSCMANQDYRRMMVEHGRGLDWPMSYMDLAPYYDRVAQEIGISGDAKAEERWRPPGAPYPMPPLKSFRHGDVWLKGFEALGMKTARATTVIYSEVFKGRPACVYDGWCNAGCPAFARHRARRNSEHFRQCALGHASSRSATSRCCKSQHQRQ